MPKKNKRAPKFRVGERVKLRDDYGAWLYGNVLSIDAEDRMFVTVGIEYHMHQGNFKKITARECGRRKSNAKEE